MVDAYRYAEGGDPKPPKPKYLLLADYIDRFGVEAVMGRRVLSAGEMRCMAVQQNIYAAFRNRERSKDWAKWANTYPEQAELLNIVMRMAEDGR